MMELAQIAVLAVNMFFGAPSAPVNNGATTISQGSNVVVTDMLEAY